MLIIRWLAEVHDSLYGGGGSGGFTTPCRGVKWSVLVPLLQTWQSFYK